MSLLITVVIWLVLSLLLGLFIARCLRVGNGPDLPDDVAVDDSGVDSLSHVA